MRESDFDLGEELDEKRVKDFWKARSQRGMR